MFGFYNKFSLSDLGEVPACTPKGHRAEGVDFPAAPPHNKLFSNFAKKQLETAYFYPDSGGSIRLNANRKPL
jgi:hypothetical protein